MSLKNISFYYKLDQIKKKLWLDSSVRYLPNVVRLTKRKLKADIFLLLLIKIFNNLKLQNIICSLVCYYDNKES